MKGLKEIFSPQSSSGSFVASIVVHLAIYGGVIAWMNYSPPVVEKPEDFIDLDYQSFDKPPDPTQPVQKVARAKEPDAPTDQKTPPDNTPHEMQDQNSDVAGRQTEKKEAAAPGSDSNGTVANVPYYKIKPKYPKAALIAGTEGWVMLQIDVNEQGGVENVRVVGGEQRNMFESEAKRAVSEWKYKPFLDAQGKPMRKKDWPVRIDFNLKDEEQESGS